MSEDRQMSMERTPWRMADALERIADPLERIANALAGTGCCESSANAAERNCSCSALPRKIEGIPVRVSPELAEKDPGPIRFGTLGEYRVLLPMRRGAKSRAIRDWLDALAENRETCDCETAGRIAIFDANHGVDTRCAGCALLLESTPASEYGPGISSVEVDALDRAALAFAVHRCGRIFTDGAGEGEHSCTLPEGHDGVCVDRTGVPPYGIAVAPETCNVSYVVTEYEGRVEKFCERPLGDPGPCPATGGPCRTGKLAEDFVNVAKMVAEEKGIELNPERGED